MYNPASDYNLASLLSLKTLPLRGGLGVKAVVVLNVTCFAVMDCMAKAFKI